ncbi:putative tubby-related protein 4 isoform X2 [Penaeus vannamei]|uniref:Putative tubby-related protein 4 isoform X2 n=1 Tax=Penaeus vannamei TaxID=6689 RepID=A0A3R7QC32_PENVA|nr:putative tubby-related protein 4 isoform X2 [Penaeus vannamei]
MCYIPETRQLRDFVSRPPCNSQRLHCTMIRHDEDLIPTPGACYTLYLEYLGGLVPLLKGKRTSKIRPEFVIFDPQVDEAMNKENGDRSCGGVGVGVGVGGVVNGHPVLSDTSDTEYEDMCASPRLQRRRKLKRRIRERLESETDELVYLDTLPEQHRLVEVTSNIWGTKFKLHGVASSLPANLGQITYKTSLLHLQPRQMTLVITELREDIPPRPDPTFNPNVFSEDEEDLGERLASRRAPDLPSDLEEHPYVDLATPEMLQLRDGLRAELRGEAHAHHALAPTTASAAPTTNHHSQPEAHVFSLVRSSAPSSPKHSVSHFCCDAGTLQSPKNIVAPIVTRHSTAASAALLEIGGGEVGLVGGARAGIKTSSPVVAASGAGRTTSSSSSSSSSCASSSAPPRHEELRLSESGGPKNDVIRYIDERAASPTLRNIDAYLAFRRSGSLKDSVKKAQLQAGVAAQRCVSLEPRDTSVLLRCCRSFGTGCECGLGQDR